METQTILCITCPKGCSLEVTTDGETIVQVRPGCKRGHEYVRRELTDPRRMIATTVRIKNAAHPLLPVYTAEAFPKRKIDDLTRYLRTLEFTAPVKMGDVLIANALDTGIDILASRDMHAVS